MVPPITRRRLPCQSCGRLVLLSESWALRQHLTCERCLALKHLGRLLDTATLSDVVPQPWARTLLEKYAAFLDDRGFRLESRWRLVRRALPVFQRMGRELSPPAAMTLPRLHELSANDRCSASVRPSLTRFLRTEELLPLATPDQSWLNKIAAGLARIPSTFASPVRQYTEFRLRIHHEQRDQHLTHVLALQTIAGDVRALCRFAEYLERRRPATTSWALVTEREVTDYLLSLVVHPNTRNVVRWDLHSFFAYAHRHRLVAHNPVPAEPGQEATSAFRPLTPEEQRGLLEMWARLQDPLESLLGCLALLHGLSSREIQHLDLSAVDHAARRLRVGGRPTLMLDGLTWRALEAYLALRPSGLAIDHNHHVVINRESRFTAEPVSQRYLLHRMQRRGVTLKHLRMTCLSTVAQESGPRLLVQAFGLSPTQASRYHTFLAYRAQEALTEHTRGL